MCYTATSHVTSTTGQISPSFSIVYKRRREKETQRKEREHTHTDVIHLHLYSNKRVESIVISSKKKKLMKCQGNITQGTNKPLHHTPNYNTSYLHSSTCGCACVHMCTHTHRHTHRHTYTHNQYNKNKK